MFRVSRRGVTGYRLHTYYYRTRTVFKTFGTSHDSPDTPICFCADCAPPPARSPRTCNARASARHPASFCAAGDGASRDGTPTARGMDSEARTNPSSTILLMIILPFSSSHVISDYRCYIAVWLIGPAPGLTLLHHIPSLWRASACRSAMGRRRRRQLAADGSSPDGSSAARAACLCHRPGG